MFTRTALSLFSGIPRYGTITVVMLQLVIIVIVIAVGAVLLREQRSDADALISECRMANIIPIPAPSPEEPDLRPKRRQP